MGRICRVFVFSIIVGLAACGKVPDDTASPGAPESTAADMEVTGIQARELAPGLSKRVLVAGDGPAAQIGQTAVVHYTGWLYDPTAPNNRGAQFDSSVDRGEHFRFKLGAGRVIRGWDEGVVGMNVGETSELTIAPELGYGQRGAGGVIPPNASLVFVVELSDLQGAGQPQ